MHNSRLGSPAFTGAMLALGVSCILIAARPEVSRLSTQTVYAPSIPVFETTTGTTTTTSVTSTTTTTAASTAVVTTTSVPATTEPSTEPPQSINSSHGALIRSSVKGTYYAPGAWNGWSSTGGSGRQLIDCNSGGDGYAKGSIASLFLYHMLNYDKNGGRTAVWLDVAGHPDMSGIYYLDDCSGADVVDFFYNANENSQFYKDGTVFVDVYQLD